MRPLSGTVAQLLLHGIGHDAYLGHSGAALLGEAVEFLGLVADFVVFTNVDPGAVGRAFQNYHNINRGQNRGQ